MSLVQFCALLQLAARCHSGGGLCAIVAQVEEGAKRAKLTETELEPCTSGGEFITRARGKHQCASRSNSLSHSSALAAKKQEKIITLQAACLAIVAAIHLAVAKLKKRQLTCVGRQPNETLALSRHSAVSAEFGRQKSAKKHNERERKKGRFRREEGAKKS